MTQYKNYTYMVIWVLQAENKNTTQLLFLIE